MIRFKKTFVKYKICGNKKNHEKSLDNNKKKQRLFYHKKIAQNQSYFISECHLIIQFFFNICKSFINRLHLIVNSHHIFIISK